MSRHGDESSDFLPDSKGARSPKGTVRENVEVSVDFIKHLRDEKLQTQTSRGKYVTQKLAYATGLLALGSLKPFSADLSRLLYLVPFLALAFDLYILGEDYSVKRIGAFFCYHSPDGLEKDWEGWVSKNRDPFAPIAMPLLTTVLAATAAFALWSQPPESPANAPRWVWYGWLVVAFLPICVISFLYRRCLLPKMQTKADEATKRVANEQ